MTITYQSGAGGSVCSEPVSDRVFRWLTGTLRILSGSAQTSENDAAHSARPAVTPPDAPIAEPTQNPPGRPIRVISSAAGIVAHIIPVIRNATGRGRQRLVGRQHVADDRRRGREKAPGGHCQRLATREHQDGTARTHRRGHWAQTIGGAFLPP